MVCDRKSHAPALVLKEDFSERLNRGKNCAESNTSFDEFISWKYLKHVYL